MSAEEEINEVIDEYYDEDVSDTIFNLSSAYQVLLEIDGALLAKEDQRELEKMKKIVFQALKHYSKNLYDCINKK